MGRPVILGNGALTIGLNEHGLVHDFYYPYVGQDNLTTTRSMHHKIGIWVDDTFSWVDDDSWGVSIDFESDALVSNITMFNNHLGVSLHFQDFVDSDINLFGRYITVTNKRPEQREIRLFTHQVFEISKDGRADTALYVPEDNYILDYKGRCSLLVYGERADGQSFDQYAVGNYGIEGKQGTYMDAQDGELSGSDVEHGGVDSVMRYTQNVEGHGSSVVSYWIIAADSQYNVEKLHHNVRKHGLLHRLESTRHYWHRWLATASNGLHLVDKDHLPLVKKSLMLVKAHTDKRGGVIAGVDSSIYNYGRDYYSYVWPRDGAYAMWPLIRLGFTEEPRKFFEFCRDILHTGGYLMHKYQSDKSIGSTWHPLEHRSRRELAIQEDETAIVLFMLGEYLDISGDEDFVRSLYMTFIRPAADFLHRFIDEETGLPHASYDLWEQKFLTTTYTAAVVYQALLTAADFADFFDYPDDSVRWKEQAERFLEHKDIFINPDSGELRKGFYLAEEGHLEFDETLDMSSFYGSFMFGYFADDISKISQTHHAIHERLYFDKTRGLARYEGDDYFRAIPEGVGNPWIICMLWMAQFYVRTGKVDDAIELSKAVEVTSLSSGVLSEQIHPETGQQISVSPLVWSHAEYINTILDISKSKHRK